MTEKDAYQMQMQRDSVDEATAKCDPSAATIAIETSAAAAATTAVIDNSSGQGEQEAQKCSDGLVWHVGHNIKHISGVLNVDDLYALPNKLRNKNRAHVDANADVVPECTSSDEGGDEKGGHEDAEDKDANKDLPPGWEKHEGENEQRTKNIEINTKPYRLLRRHKRPLLLAHQIGHHSTGAARLVQTQQRAATTCTYGGRICGHRNRRRSPAAVAAGTCGRAANAVGRLDRVDRVLVDGRRGLDCLDKQLLQPDGQQWSELGDGSASVSFTGAQTRQTLAQWPTGGCCVRCNR